MRGYLADVWRHRHFWLSLVRMDLQSRYRRSVLGIGWSLLHPLATTVVQASLAQRCGIAGAPGSLPGTTSPLSAWLRTPQGSTANSTTHQMMK